MARRVKVLLDSLLAWSFSSAVLPVFLHRQLHLFQSCHMITKSCFSYVLHRCKGVLRMRVYFIYSGHIFNCLKIQHSLFLAFCYVFSLLVRT